MLASLFSDDRLLVFLAGLGLLALFFWYFATDFERKKRNIGTIIVALIAVFSMLAIVPKEKWMDVITGKTPIAEASNLKGGIDLVGGSSFTLRVQPSKDTNGEPIPLSSNSVQQAIKTVEDRLNAFGTSDLLIIAQGEDRILVQMPGVSPQAAEEVRITLEQIAKLELKTVHPESRILADRVAADPENEIVPGYELKVLRDTDEDGKATAENILVSRRASLDGSYVVHAQELYGPYEGKLSVELNSDGATKMFDLTKQMRHGQDRLAIVLDGEVLSAPVVQSSLGKNFEISGMENAAEAKSLAAALLNPLKNPLLVEEQRAVSATLGKETVHQGIFAGIAGLGLTLIFVLIYYRFAGMIALIGLAFNIIVLFGTMAMFGFTFTLPGIAGIILTIGVAVDANVLIYERLREELAAGKSIKAAISAAYDKAFSAIFDANITTLITALILFWRASGTVKGFAVTLTIGILASMLAALLCTRVLFWWFSDKEKIKKLNFMNLIPNRAFDFLGQRKLAFSVSAVLLLASISTLGIKNDNALGIDFAGGAQLTFQFEGDVMIDQTAAHDVIESLTLSKTASSFEETNSAGNHLLTVRCAVEDVPVIEEGLRKSFPVLQEQVPALDNNGQPKLDGANEPVLEYKWQTNVETVSASLGKEFLTTAVWALLIGLIAIMIYITVRFEFSFALGAFAALIHDIIICLGFVVLSGEELSLIHVGAFLTIAGYSINDTIVVFDRIREDLRVKRGDVKEVMNNAITSTLSRTVLTSITTFVAVLVLFIFGGTALRDFSFTIMMGVVIGTYSSIFIASPIVYMWSKLRGINLRRELLDANLEAEVNPAKS
ncbi:protein translocase subunit SecD [Verrucomicrobiaceae bacterium R5-34]|uniref:Multifunctional fusion protein n=1 Tax=Oceaniferula flava TaxID=2800421 RepID=A0AAE2SCR8_9BACT|nr:protein translocase subunit SecD [Oceaniferula flavus]MBK1829710.1 protein translocase subunit SecD [Verrucomicrobiaceae bacterium R5-34]MBK1853896.1 protein translocase subunit SecD [Oceaniferula flavus]MBM1135202.1 protein translocase subunit SecD [Oceaniferula flavus]